MASCRLQPEEVLATSGAYTPRTASCTAVDQIRQRRAEHAQRRRERDARQQDTVMSTLLWKLMMNVPSAQPHSPRSGTGAHVGHGAARSGQNDENDEEDEEEEFDDIGSPEEVRARKAIVEQLANLQATLERQQRRESERDFAVYAEHAHQLNVQRKQEAALHRRRQHPPVASSSAQQHLFDMDQTLRRLKMDRWARSVAKATEIRPDATDAALAAAAEAAAAAASGDGRGRTVFRRVRRFGEHDKAVGPYAEFDHWQRTRRLQQQSEAEDGRSSGANAGAGAMDGAVAAQAVTVAAAAALRRQVQKERAEQLGELHTVAHNPLFGKDSFLNRMLRKEKEKRRARRGQTQQQQQQQQQGAGAAGGAQGDLIAQVYFHRTKPPPPTQPSPHAAMLLLERARAGRGSGTFPSSSGASAGSSAGSASASGSASAAASGSASGAGTERERREQRALDRARLGPLVHTRAQLAALARASEADAYAAKSVLSALVAQRVREQPPPNIRAWVRAVQRQGQGQDHSQGQGQSPPPHSGPNTGRSPRRSPGRPHQNEEPLPASSSPSRRLQPSTSPSPSSSLAASPGRQLDSAAAVLGGRPGPRAGGASVGAGAGSEAGVNAATTRASTAAAGASEPRQPSDAEAENNDDEDEYEAYGPVFVIKGEK